ncbi:MAG TPA: acyl-CoA dehydrogenase family protein [Microbacteriaceae bacterium]|nr:acyl-CoA dehydrogenase family protein [Microbacteriaceae bacterium]
MSIGTIREQHLEIDSARGRELVEAARQLSEPVRVRARQAEINRAVSQEIVDLAEQAGLLSAMVPKAFGGDGLGFDVLCEVSRVLAAADPSTAWTIAFLMEHNWLVCHMPMEGQRELFADRDNVKVAGALAPTGTAVPVEGGFTLNGHWKYNSASANSDWIIIGANVLEQGEQIPYAILVPKDQLTVHDDWHMSGMAATSSASVTATDVFVPERFAIEVELFHSAKGHPGAVHEESIYRYPMLFGLTHMMCAFAVGTAEGALAIAKDRLAGSKPWGKARSDREASRIRWGMAHQQVRAARLLYEHSLAWLIRKCDAEEEWSLEEQGQLALDQLAVAHMAKDAVRSLLDGLGSSPYNLEDPLQRYLRDIHVIANHLGQDYDVVAERGSRWLLGLGRVETDPFPARTTERAPRS